MIKPIQYSFIKILNIFQLQMLDNKEIVDLNYGSIYSMPGILLSTLFAYFIYFSQTYMTY